MEATELAEAAADRDPGAGLAAVAALRALLEELEAMHVSNARSQGWSWERIADALGVRRQTVHRKHARRTKG
ncbi:helix-turn-helix domain-containing protein [Nonomuraea phyllanthi]|uniref:Helix-turn-helix domain-containing protein n=1 Tax=Nonomuraea phyllanthi TaxID=2219224 RepID=A0A5C4UY94_9ACTN|nr:helix-turn-helix domain-containing protein [Nonomuraea phyllanthi]KAB8183610.1 helix-turn-helix domain-containing protein [Nonomuraea phyllanthi]QFY09479.1 helix-turn-helix domain-containing protein [Nonomuraea phyllanthi]